MSELQTANILLALAGNKGETVPKYGVTAAEVAVLRLIHGDQSVYDIEVTGSVPRTHRQEIGRLTELYGRQEGERRVAPAVSALYPGAAARVFETFEELELDDDFYVAATRRVATPEPAARPAAQAASEDDKALDDMTLRELQAYAEKAGIDLVGVTKKADVLEAIKLHVANAGEPDDEADDEVQEMDDGLFK